MNALNPWAIAVGAALMGLPLAIHYLTRPKPKRFQFSAMKFIEGAIRQRRFFNRLRDILILAVRALLVAAIALAFARPVMKGAAATTTEGVRRLVVVDISNSMHAHARGMGVFQRARAKAMQYTRYDPNLRANVLFAAARPRAVFDRFSANFAALQSEIRTVEPRQEALNVQAVVAEAARLFQEDAGTPGQLVLITDLQKSNWNDLPALNLPPRVEFVIEHVGLGDSAGNLAIVDASPKGLTRNAGQIVLSVDVENFTDTPQIRTIRLEANGRPYSQEVSLDAWAKASALFELSREQLLDGAQGGWISGKAELADANDALPTDNVRHFAFEVLKPPRFALISRHSPAQVGSSSYFLSRMLCPAAGASEAAEAILHMSPGAMPPERLSICDFIAIVQPGRMGQEEISRISEMLVRGRPVLYVISESADVINLEQFEAFCRPSLSLPVRFTTGSMQIGRPANGADRGTPVFHLGEANLNKPPLDEFAADPNALISELYVERVLKTSTVPEVPADDIIAKWDDGSAAFLMLSAGSGKMMIWNGDMEGSPLIRSPQFVALIRASSARMLQDSAPQPAAFPSGIPCVIPVSGFTPQDSPVVVQDLAGNKVEDCAAGVINNQLCLRWPQAGPPGTYTVTCEGAAISSFAVACPSVESDLRPLTAEEVTLALDSGKSDEPQNVRIFGLDGKDAPAEDREVWAWVMVAAIVCMILELSTLKFFRI